MNINNLTNLICDKSNDFEQNNSKLKKDYLLKNINTFNIISKNISTSVGTFGTGYPYYVLDYQFKKDLPIIQEQIDYNNELISNIEEEWVCLECLKDVNYKKFPDLKKFCKPCPKMYNKLKPRRVINRLPDLDMWLIVEDGSVESSAKELSNLLNFFNIYSSDVNPIKTIKDFIEISSDIKKGVMPKKYLPIDVHIIEISKLKDLIRQIPDELNNYKKGNNLPYIPINPLSYRKEWQYDDEAYNFVLDFLYSFYPFTNNKELNNLIKNTRRQITREHSAKDLIKIVYNISPESNKRRMQTSQIIENLEEKFLNWGNKSSNNDRNMYDLEK